MRQGILAVRRELRLVLPDAYVLSGLLLIYVSTDVVLVLSNVPLGWGWLPRKNPAACLFMLLAAASYGAYRVIYFHPLYQPEYGKWLRRSPWTAGRPLPNGPVHLVWQDVVLLSVMTALSMRSDQFPPLSVVAIFLLAYLLMMSWALKVTGQGTAAFLVLMTSGGFFRALPWPIIAGACLATSYIFAMWGLHRSLVQFREWDLDWWEDRGTNDLFNNGKPGSKMRQQELGWPFDQITLKGVNELISVSYGLAVAVLCGWGAHILWYFAEIGPGGESTSLPVLVVAMPSAVLAFGRALRYCNGYSSPISLWGRLVTFRWIIPRYDLVFVPSLMILLVGMAGPSILSSVGIPLIYGGPMLLTIMIALTLTMPPSLERWRLTGGHRVVPAPVRTGEFVQTQ